MYNSSYEYNNYSFPYRNFFIRLIIIICLILLIFWGVSELTRGKNKENIKFDSSEVFQKNLTKMKTAALQYFTEDTIPNEAKKTKKVSLKKLQNKKLINKLYDSNNKSCDAKRSYVRLSKSGTKYILKTSLTCGKETDYIISHLIYSTDCDKTFLCENINTNDNKNKKEDTKKDTNSKSGDTENTLPSTSSSKISKISSSKSGTTKLTTKTTYTKKRKAITDYNTKGKIIVKDTTKSTTKETKLSNWSLWSDWERASCSITDTYCSTNDSSCLSEVKTYSRKERISTYTKTYSGNHLVLQKTGTITESECPGYNYVIIDGIHYRTNSNSYDLVKDITTNTAANLASWHYDGRYTYSTHMNDTINTKYIFITADYSNCNNTCSPEPKYIYDKYTYNSNLDQDYSSCSADSRVWITIPVYRLLSTNISVEHEENLYGTVCYISKRTRTILNK